MNKVDINVESRDSVDLNPVKKKYDQFANGLVADMKTMGDKAGRGFTDGLAAGMEKASARVVKANQAQVRAIEQLQIAQQRLSEVQANDTAKLSTRMSAEQSFTDALRAVQAATDDVAAAEAHLHNERAKAASSPATQKSRVEFDLGDSLGRIKGQAISELKATGIQAGAVFAGALAAGVSSLGAAGLFVGIAAAAQSQNDIVRASYRNLWEQVKQGAQESSSVLAQDFVAGAEKLGATFNKLNPMMREGFIAAKPAVDALFDGTSRLAQEAMPGIVRGAQAASEASQGLADMMDSTGKGVAAFFTESAAGAAAGGESFRSFGNIVERMGSFAGRMFAMLANSSVTVFPQLESVVDSAAGTIEQFAKVALPGIASGAGLALSGLGLLLNLASSLIGVLGPLVPLVGTFATSLKLIDMVSFGQVQGSWDRLKSSIGEAEGFAGKAKAGFGALLSSGFLPLMAGGIALTGILNELSKDQQRAADATRAHEQNVSDLAAALRKSKGAMDDNVRAAAAQSLGNIKVGDTGKNVLNVANQLGISLPRLTEGFMGNSSAMKDVNGMLDNLIASGTTYIDTESGKQAVTTQSADSARMLKIALAANNTTMEDAILKNKALDDATGKTTANTNILSDAFGVLNDKASNAQQKMQALVEIMDVMAGRKPDIEATSKAWEEFLDKFNAKDGGFESGIAGTQKWAAALIDAQGHINLTTEDGRKLFDLVRGAEQDFAGMAQAMKDSGASQDEVTAKLQGMRDSFISVAQKMGFTKEQAELLANAYGLVPGNVSTIVNSNLAPELQKAIALGGTIQALPDGYFVVTANTSQAQYQITKFVQDNQGHVITVKVNTTTGAQTNTSTSSSGSRNSARLKAAGGPVSSVMAAAGGARSGITVVNEAGIESANLPNGDKVIMPTGTQVNPHSGNRELAAMGQPMQLILSLDVSGIEGPFSRAMADIFRKKLRVSGKAGNINAWLGGRSA